MVITFDAPLLSRTMVAKNTLEVFFDTSAYPFNFIAGQYVTISLYGFGELSPRERYRDLSIASSSEAPHKLGFVFRLSPSRFKQTLLAVPLGTCATITRPKGIFTFPETPATIVCIAGGVGIAPFL